MGFNSDSYKVGLLDFCPPSRSRRCYRHFRWVLTQSWLQRRHYECFSTRAPAARWHLHLPAASLRELSRVEVVGIRRYCYERYSGCVRKPVHAQKLHLYSRINLRQELTFQSSLITSFTTTNTAARLVTLFIDCPQPSQRLHETTATDGAVLTTTAAFPFSWSLSSTFAFAFHPIPLYISLDLFTDYAQSKPARIQAVIDANGDATKY